MTGVFDLSSRLSGRRDNASRLACFSLVLKTLLADLGGFGTGGPCNEKEVIA